MKTISSLLLVSSLLLAMVSPPEALAGGCGPTGCSAVNYVAPNVPRAAATTSSSHAFTAIGGSRVAEHNLSQEALDVINAGGKEEPLPKGVSTAADRIPEGSGPIFYSDHVPTTAELSLNLPNTRF